MFEKIKKLVIAAVMVPVMMMAAEPVSAVTDLSQSSYWFRYRGGDDYRKDTNPYESKDIVAFFIGGVGMPFSEKLPIKPQWQGLTWKFVDDTSLPSGLSFDSVTRTFSGTPDESGRNHVVQMVGYSVAGEAEATAQVTFDIFEVQGEPFNVLIYAHTNKYKYFELPAPANATIDSWVFGDLKPPPGVTINGPYFEGTPTLAGSYPLYAFGRDYLGNVVATYIINYLVEDGPTFDIIPDDIRTLSPSGTPGWHWSGYFKFGSPSKYPVLHKIDPSKNVRYYLRIESVDGLPGNVTSNSNPTNLMLEGFVTQPYDTGVAHFFAIDSDGTTGRSNSFTFGTGDPTPLCKMPPYAPEKVIFVTGKEAKTQLAVPFGAQGTPLFTIVEGELPEGLSMEDGGRVVGVPKYAQDARKVGVQVDVINDEKTTTAGTCYYQIGVVNKALKLQDTTDAQNRHGRVGAPYSGQLTVSGGIPDFSVDWIPDVMHPTLSADVPSLNADVIPVTGTFEKAGLPTKYGFNVTNGDDNTASGNLNIYGYGPLAFGANPTAVPNVVVRRLGNGTWGQVPYDKDTVVPDTSGAVDHPLLNVDPSSALPAGISFDGRAFVGMTQDPEGQYGPLTVTMSDYTGEAITSDPFYLTVEHRDEVSILAVPSPVFIVERPEAQQGTNPVLWQPPGAKDFSLSWTLSGPDLPVWAHFDPSTGVISADANIPYAELNQPSNETLYGPYTLTVSDADPLTPSTSEPSAEFFIRLTDLAPPNATTHPDVRGNVSGDAADGFLTKAVNALSSSPRTKTVTNITARDFTRLIDPDTIIGEPGQVIFTGSDPVAPAGVPLQISQDGHDAWFDGKPTEPFEGIVKVFFKDIRGRQGFVRVPMEIRPYPTIAMTQSEYDLPRLAPAFDYDIVPQKLGSDVSLCEGCWTAPRWEIDASGGDLPEGLSVNPSNGMIVGSTPELDDQTPDNRSPFSGIVLKATSRGANGEMLETWTDSFSINIKPRVPMTLRYPSGPDIWYLEELETSGYGLVKRDVSEPRVGGSSQPALSFSMDKEGLAQGQDLNQTTGVFAWDLSRLKLGKWNPLVTVTDADGQQASTDLQVKATLDGDVVLVEGAGSITVRQSEAFATGIGAHHALLPPIKVDKVVGDMTYRLLGAPDTVHMTATSGNFLESSRIDTSGSWTPAVTGTDADGRKLDRDARFYITVVPPLTFAGLAPVVPEARQYSVDERIDVAFPEPADVMGEISYEVRAAEGSAIPGTVVYKAYDPDSRNFLFWQWMDGDGREHIVQSSDLRWSEKLPLDALVFDPMTRRLEGIPSRHGTFVLELVARDSHMDSYLHVDDIHPEEMRIENNTAVMPITVVVAPAHPLEISTRNADGESFQDFMHQYTSSPSLHGVVKNAAYGRDLSWEKTAGSLPSGVSEVASSVDFRLQGYADNQGTFDGLVFKGTDRAGRAILTSEAPHGRALRIVVGERQAFSLAASENPRRMAVNLTDAALSVLPVNAAYGLPPGKAKWTVSGTSNLPQGVTHTVSDGSVMFSGKARKVGTYGPVTVSATDALGMSATVSLEFHVRIPDGPIALDVRDVRTKPGYPFQMLATSSNTYGQVRYYSYDINEALKGRVRINEGSGRIEGVMDEPYKDDFDVYVTDETNRVTSRPVLLEVIPFIRTTVPDVVKGTSTKPLTQTVATDYVLGTARFKKGGGNWPNNLAVDPVTGTISGTTTSAPGTYSDLTIEATDTFMDQDGNMYTDVKLSNAFTVALDGIPDIANVNSNQTNRNMLLTQGVQMQAWKPTVTDTTTKAAWNLPGTFFSLNKDLEFDTGLTFDPSTGEISGTPTKTVVYTDLTITVNSPHGNTDATAPFYFAVQPQGAVTAAPGQKTLYKQRMGTMFSTDAPVFDNTVGEVTYSQKGMPAGLVLDTKTGVVSGTTTTVGDYNIDITVKDGAGRTATFRYMVQSRGALALSLQNHIDGLNIGQTYTATTNRPTAANVGGTAAFTVEGLPEGIDYDPATGGTFGSPSPSIANGTRFDVTVKLVDDYDGAERQITYAVTVALPILPAQGQKETYNQRMGIAFSTDAPVFTNAVGAVTYAAAPLPAGVSLNTQTGVISGTPAISGSVPFTSTAVTVTVTDSTGRTGKFTYTVNYHRQLGLALANPVIGIDFGRDYTAFNKPTVSNLAGKATYVAENLPEGLAVGADGSISGTVASGRYPVGETFSVAVKVIDDYDGSEKTVGYTLTVAEPITIGPDQKTLYRARVGQTVSTDAPSFLNTFGAVTLSQSGKPAWLTFDATTGRMNGTATTSLFNGPITITARDSIGRTATFQYTVTTKGVLAMTLTPTVNGIDFDGPVSAINRPAISNVGETATVTATGLPAGLAVDAGGGVSGTVASGTYQHGDTFDVKIRLEDSFDGEFREVGYVLTVGNKITVTPGQKELYRTRVGDTFIADAPLFENMIGTVTYSQSGKAATLSFDAATGVVSGPVGNNANFPITITARDATGRSASFRYDLQMRSALTLAITPQRGMDVGKVYPSNTNLPVGGSVNGTASFEDVDGVIASMGFLFNTNNGSFSGLLGSSLSVGEAFEARVRLRDTYDDLRMQLIQEGNVAPPASDPNPGFREVTYTMTVVDPIIVPPGQKTSHVGRVGDQFTIPAPVIQNLYGDVVYSATGMPAWLSLDAATGQISGTVGGASTHTIRLTATDSTGRVAVMSHGLVTKGVLSLSITNPVTEIRQSSGQVYSAINRPVATNVGTSLSYSATGLPPEFLISPTTGAISGSVARSTYPEGTEFAVVVTATDSFDGLQKSVEYTLKMVNAPAPGISISPSPTGYNQVAQNLNIITITDGKAGDVVELAPDSAPLPAGMSLFTSNSTWMIAKPTTKNEDIGVYRGIKLKVTDVDGLVGVSPPAVLILRSNQNLAYPAQTIRSRPNVPVDIDPPTASAGIPTASISFEWSVDRTNGTLSIDRDTGRITGSFNANVTNGVTVKEYYDDVVIRTFSYNVDLRILPLTLTMEDVGALVGQPISQKFAVKVDNPTSQGRYSLSGDVPSWLGIDPETGDLHGTPDEAGVHELAVTYQDDWDGKTAPFRLTVTGGNRGFKFIRYEKGTTYRALLRELYLFDEYGTDVTRLAELRDVLPAGTDYSPMVDRNTNTGVDSASGAAWATLEFPTRINFIKAQMRSQRWENYCVREPWKTTANCPSPGWSYDNAPAVIYGSNDGTNWIQIGSVPQTTQTKDSSSALVTIPLTQAP